MATSFSPRPFSCGYNMHTNSTQYSMLDFQPIFNTGMSGMVSNYTGNDIPVCNVDPSQSTFDFAIAVTGEFCDLPEDDVYFAAAYTGAADGSVTLVTATTTLPPTVTSSFVVVYTGLPYSAVSDGGEVRLTAFNNVYSSYTTTFACVGDGTDGPRGFTGRTTGLTTSTNYYTNVFSMIQTYVPTLVYTDTTQTLSFSTVPTSVTTSTITETGLAVAPAETSTITTSSGTATIQASPIITTTTRTITRQDITHTAHAIAHTVTYITCIPTGTPNANAAVVRRDRSDKSYRLRSLLHKRLDSSSNSTISNTTTSSAASYITGNCAPLTITTLTTNTVFVSSTLTLNNTVTSTAFATTSSLSTYTPTNTVYAVAIDTVTVTPTLTRHAISIVKRKTIVVTTTNTRTKSVYPRHPPGCAMPTVN